MNDTNKNRIIVLSITEGGLTPTEAATRFGVSTRWIRTLMARYRTGGLNAIDTRSTRPHSNPNATSQDTINQILTLRTTLTTNGLDAGPESIWDRLPETNRPSTATIWRILRRHDHITDQPQKRPRSSWHRFEATAPNGSWQSDFPPQAGGTPTHWPLADGTDTEIISWLDDHSRKLLHISPHARVTGPIVIDTFTTTMDEFGPPASTLTDNGMVYTTRLARGNDGTRSQPNGFEQLLADLNIEQKNGTPNHPTTQGKIERFHQTLKRWLTADGHVDTIKELATQLHKFQHIYNTERPHRAIGRRTPDTVYDALPKAEPVMEIGRTVWRVRYDQVGSNGTVSIRHAGRMRHLAVGRGYAGHRIIVLTAGTDTMIIDRDAGAIVAEHTIDPAKGYQSKK